MARDDDVRAIGLLLNGVMAAQFAVLLKLHERGALPLAEAREALVAVLEEGQPDADWRAPIERLIKWIDEVEEGDPRSILKLIRGGGEGDEG